MITKSNLTLVMADQLKKEVEIMLKMKNVQNSNVVKFHDLYETSNAIYIFLDYCNGGSIA